MGAGTHPKSAPLPSPCHTRSEKDLIDRVTPAASSFEMERGGLALCDQIVRRDYENPQAACLASAVSREGLL